MPNEDPAAADAVADSAAPEEETADDRHEAITEILAELRGDDEEADEEAEASEEPDIGSSPEPDTDREPAAEGPADEADTEPSPDTDEEEAEEEELIDGFTPSQLASMLGEEALSDENIEDTGPRGLDDGDEDRRELPAGKRAAEPRVAQVAVGTPRALIVIQGAMLIIFGLGTWLTFRYVAGSVTTLAHALGESAARQAPRAQASPTVRSGPARQPGLEAAHPPVPRIDMGLRYTQKMDEGARLFEKQQYEGAAAAYRGALAAMPSNWNDGAAAFRLGQCYFRLEDYPQAISAYKRVESAYGAAFRARALFQRGESHLATGDYRKARDAFYSLLLTQDRYGPEAGPWVERAYYRVADCYWLDAESLRSTSGRRPPADPSRKEEAE